MVMKRRRIDRESDGEASSMKCTAQVRSKRRRGRTSERKSLQDKEKQQSNEEEEHMRGILMGMRLG